MFHLLRRQMVRNCRKPLIIMTPKSLLRHKLCVSTLEDLTHGRFHWVLPEVDELDAKVRRVIICSGKIYYELLEARRVNRIHDIAILRIEQIYPFPGQQLDALLAQYTDTDDLVWCQEEPKNQGAWYQIRHHLQACHEPGQALLYVGRVISASTFANARDS